MSVKTNYLALRSSVRNVFSPSSAGLPIYANPEITYDNCLDHHTPLRLLASTDQALNAVNRPRCETPSPWVHVLASADKPTSCRFRLYRNPSAVDALEESLVQRYPVPDASPQVIHHKSINQLINLLPLLLCVAVGYPLKS